MSDDSFVPVFGPWGTLYEVNRLGVVRRVGGKPLTPSLNKQTGYYNVGFYCAGTKRKLCRVHRLLAEAFIPRVFGKTCVDHVNGIRTDNRLENLRWCTHAENLGYAKAMGSFENQARGEASGRSKLNEEKVRQIRVQYPAKTLEELAKLFGVSRMSVGNVVKWKTWRHVGTPPQGPQTCVKVRANQRRERLKQFHASIGLPAPTFEQLFPPRLPQASVFELCPEI